MDAFREAVVLAGGFGTRLAHVVPGVCKPMAPVAGQPFLRFIMDQLAAAKFDHVIIADGYKSESIESAFGDFYRGISIDYSHEDHPLGTGGALRRALELCESAWVYVLNGDTFFDIDFSRFGQNARQAHRDVQACIAAKHMQGFERYGTLDIAADGTIAAFNEKKPCSEGLINGGVYLIRANALIDMPEAFSLETDWFETVVGGGALKAAICDGEFIDIGVPDDYHRAQTLLAPRVHRGKLVLFDRDGTINVDTGHLFEPEKLQLIPGTIELMRAYAQDPAMRIAVVTNQAGIAKGLYSEKQMRCFHHAMDEELEKVGCRVDAYYFCPHHPLHTGACSCRKPAPGMLLKAMRDFDARPDECVMYGDQGTDALAASAAGISFVMISDRLA